jgi:hypothetical protein
MQRAVARNASHDTVDVGLWPAEWDDPELVVALAAPADYDALFELGLEALIARMVAPSA